MQRTRTILMLAILAITTSASAQSLDDRFHFGLGTRLAYVSYQSLKSEPTDDSLGLSIPDRRISAGFGEGMLTSSLGYAFADRWVLDLQASFDHTPATDGQSDAQTGFSVGPALRYVFAPGATARPFLALGAHGGARLGGDYGYWSVGGDIGAGVQVWLMDKMSIDPQLALSYDHRNEQTRFGSENSELLFNTVSLGGHVMLSVWI